ncbi:hypothetical protein [Methylobacterium indicum]|uniref:hypothetical protein n=1 Tax=Methylobacterium indicum TaxID=1775910 RepID=UPI002434B5E3|nr:hypothetical protein [Methylobacterium indicum]
MSHHATHIVADVASRGMMAFSALEHAVADFRLQAAERRRNDIYAVADLATALQESRAVEGYAVEAASALHDENRELRAAISALTAALRGERQAHAQTQAAFAEICAAIA